MSHVTSLRVKASLNHLHIAPRKVRLVAGLIRGLDLPRAELELKSISKRSATPLLKLLRSALANARHNFNLENPRDLIVKELAVNAGPMLKRFRPRAFGRAAMIRKKTSHIVLILESKMEANKKVHKSAGPEVRDVFGENIKDKEDKKIKTAPTVSEKTKKATKGKGFMKKVFQRKTI